MGGGLTVGELIERFADQIPLHRASRKWAANQKRAKELKFPSPYKMRSYALTQELHWLQCTFDPPGLKTYQTRVFVNALTCADCGGLFVAEKRRPVHGLLCPARKRAHDP